MALSGSFSSKLSNSYFSVKVAWSATQNISANTSTVTVKLYIVSNSSQSALHVNSKSWSITCDGTTVSGTANMDLYGGDSDLIATKSFTLSHDSSCKKSFTLK